MCESVHVTACWLSKRTLEKGWRRKQPEHTRTEEGGDELKRQNQAEVWGVDSLPFVARAALFFRCQFKLFTSGQWKEHNKIKNASGPGRPWMRVWWQLCREKGLQAGHPEGPGLWVSGGCAGMCFSTGSDPPPSPGCWQSQASNEHLQGSGLGHLGAAPIR